MIAQRMAELRLSASKWQQNLPREVPLTSPGILSSRRSALLERQPQMDGTTLTGKSETSSTGHKRSALEERKNELSQSTAKWKSRVRVDPDLEALDRNGRIKKDLKSVDALPSTLAPDIAMGLERFYTNSRISAPSVSTEVSSVDLDDITSTSRLVMPLRAGLRGRMRGRRSRRLPEFSQPCSGSTPVTPVNYRLKQCDSDDESAEGLSSSARRGLQSKIDYTTVALKKVETKSAYPDLMLIRIKGEKFADVRLVAPGYKSVHAYACFILVTPTRIFLYNGKYSNLLERTKAMLIVSSVCTRRGELGCLARDVEKVSVGQHSDFWRLLGADDEAAEDTDSRIPAELLNICEPFEVHASRANAVFQVGDDYSMCLLEAAVIPKCTLLLPNANLLFDFGSEIYVWTGREADRTGAQYALAYAAELRSQEAKHLKDCALLFGDDLKEGRPDWCITIRLTQGLDDCLFRFKFPDWRHTAARLATKWKGGERKGPLLNPLDEEILANHLGRCLASSDGEESVLVLEDTELPRCAENVITERVTYFVLEKESELREIDRLRLFFDKSCYVIKWEYRVQRPGIRKLDGSVRQRDTGRPRIAFFFWLGANTTKKEQGLCALALRNLDRERHPHERVLQGQEPCVFLQLFDGQMIIAGGDSGVFVVLGSSIMSEYRMQELAAPVVLRSHASYVLVTDTVIVWHGSASSSQCRSAAVRLAQELTRSPYPRTAQLNNNLHDDIVEVAEGDPFCDLPVITAFQWIKAPRLIRLYDTEGEEVSCVQWDPLAPFSFWQEDLRDTMIVDQGSGFWLWTENVVSTYALRVAHSFSESRDGFARVIWKTREPPEFKALFPQWLDFVDEIDENELCKEIPIRFDPCEVEELLASRTQHWPLEKVVSRELPLGADLKRLEQYLNDADFESTFEMSRNAFYELPSWRQIELRKKHNLF